MLYSATKQEATSEYKKALNKLKPYGLEIVFTNRLKRYSQYIQKYNLEKFEYYGEICSYILNEKQDILNKYHADNI